MLFRATVCAHGKSSYLCIAVGKLLMILTFFLNNFSFKFSIKD